MGTCGNSIYAPAIPVISLCASNWYQIILPGCIQTNQLFRIENKPNHYLVSSCNELRECTSPPWCIKQRHIPTEQRQTHLSNATPLLSNVTPLLSNVTPLLSNVTPPFGQRYFPTEQSHTLVSNVPPLYWVTSQPWLSNVILSIVTTLLSNVTPLLRNVTPILSNVTPLPYGETLHPYWARHTPTEQRHTPTEKRHTLTE